MSRIIETDWATGGPQTSELDSGARGGVLHQVDRVVLVGNYARDRQHSMLRFADLMNRELNARANRIARSLRSEGIGRGALVALCLPRGIDMVIVVG